MSLKNAVEDFRKIRYNLDRMEEELENNKT